MNVRSDNVNFERAIDTRHVRPLIERALAGNGLNVSGEIRVPRVFPMGDGCYSVEYRVAVQNGARAFLAPVCGCLAADGPVPERYLDDDRVSTDQSRSLAVPAFGFDPRLDAIAEIAGGDGAALPHSAMGEGDAGEWATVEGRLIAHRLEKRGVFRFEVSSADGNRATRYLKVARRKRARAAAAVYASLQKAGFKTDGLALAEVLGVDASRGLLLMDAAPGRSLHDCIDDGHPGDAMEAAAALMQRLHEMPVDPAWNRHGPGDELDQLEKWRHDIAALYPGLADAMAERIDRLEGRRPAEVDAPVPVHGDFHDKQVLFARECSTLIDCDGVSAGDAARDHGNFLAHVELRRLQHPGREQPLAAGLDRFNERYPMSGARLRWWTACALTRLSAVYVLRPAWRGLSATLLERADTELEREVAGA